MGRSTLPSRGPATGRRVLAILLCLLTTLGFATTAAGAPTALAAVTGVSVSQRSSMAAIAWNDVPGAASYLVELSRRANFSDATELAASTSVTIATSLRPGTDYHVRVSALDASGSRGRASAVLDFTTSAAPQEEPEADPLVVGSYNVSNAKRHGGWSSRRYAVRDIIASQNAAVVGLQEATFKRVAASRAQYNDIIGLLGPSWRVTADGSSMLSEGTRIIYDSAKLKLGEHGFTHLANSKSGHSWRNVVWAYFTQKTTGKRFLFMTTHLTSGQSRAAYARKVSQARQIAALAKAKADGLPVVITGDFNSNKFSTPNNGPYNVMTGAGFVDPLGNTNGRSASTSGIAQKQINVNLASFNGYERTVRRANYATAANVDYIFLTPGVTVTEWETVVRMDAAGRFIGTIPSDHNMVRATLQLP